MFTGIVESIGRVVEIISEHSNIHFQLKCPFAQELRVDQSLSHDGVCLTVTKIDSDFYWVTAINETLGKTNLHTWKTGTEVNLERCLPVNGRFDGHIVQGHVDHVATCTMAEERDGSWVFGFQYDARFGNLTVKKGSICINGVSLTVVDSEMDYFSVAIIPYTMEHTNFHQLKPGSIVNLEFDIVGKYIKKLVGLQGLNH